MSALNPFPSGSAAIVGVCESPRRRAPGIHPYEIHAEVVAGALEDAGLTAADVDGFATASAFPSEAGWQLGVVELAEYLGLQPRWLDSTDLGGAAFLSHAGHAVAAITAGLCETVVVTYASAGRSSPLPAQDLNTGADGPGQWEVPYGPSTVSAYALAAQRYMHEYGAKPEELAAIAVQCRANAGPNPDAMYRDPITVDDVLSGAMIASPLHKLDCCVVSDSGGAFVITSKARAEHLSIEPVYILGFGEAASHTQMNQMLDMTVTSAVRSGADAFRTAGMTHADIDVAQLYDSFTITVALALESLGFVDRGEAGGFITDGNISPTGVLPINTDGGGLSSNHPGRRGALAVIEGVRQLQGRSPGIQLQDPKTCLVNGTGGWLSVNSTLVLGV